MKTANPFDGSRGTSWEIGEVQRLNLDCIGQHVVIAEPLETPKGWLPVGSCLQYQGARVHPLGGIRHRLGWLCWDSYLDWYSKREWSVETEISFAFVNCTPAVRPYVK